LGLRARVYGNFNIQGRLLLVGAHPDDCGLAMGSLAYAGFPHVSLVVFTRGTEENPRLLPAIAEALVLGADSLYIGDASDEQGPELSQSNIVTFWQVLERLSPSIVVTHLPMGDPHPCHTKVSELVNRAISRMPELFRPRLLYATPPAEYDAASFTPDIHVVVNDPLALILAAAIHLHPSEYEKKYYKLPHKLNSMVAQASILNRHGLMAGCNFAESFMTAKIAK